MEIKKRKRFVTKVFRPTLSNMLRKESLVKFAKARSNGSLVTYVRPFENFDVYRYYPDRYNEDKDQEASNLL